MSTRVEVPASPALRLLACFAVILVVSPGRIIAQSKVRVEIEGVDAELERNVRAIMEIAREAETGLMTRQRIDRLHVRATADIETALQPFGYYQPHIEKSLEPDGDALIARYVVDPGVQVHIRTLEIMLTGPGQDDPAFLAAKSAFPL